MTEKPARTISRMFDELAATGRRISAEAQAGRPADQPAGEGARLSSVHWYLGPLGDVQIQNLEVLFSDGCCTECSVPLGQRTRRRMEVRYSNALSRRCDGVLANAPDSSPGPTFNLFSKRFLSLLSAAERRCLRWREVTVTNPTKTTPPLFEIVQSQRHVAIVALRGGNPERDCCDGCGRRGPPSYPLVGCLPIWLNPTGQLARGDQPELYIGESSLPDPVAGWFTIGEWTRGVHLALSADSRRSMPDGPGTRGIHIRPLGSVAPDLIDTER